MRDFSVQQSGPSLLTYVEGDHVMHVHVETGFKRPPKHPIGERELDNLLLIVYGDSISCWLPPFDGEVVAESDRRRIIANIARELHARGEEFVIE